MAKKKLISFNIQNEQVVLSTMIKSDKERRKLCKELKPYNWIGKKHRIIFNVLCRMESKNLKFDIDTFESLVKDDEEYGGIQYLIKVQKLFEENVNIDYHVQILKTDSIKHHIKERRMERLVDALEDPHSDISNLNEIINSIKEEVSRNFSTNKILSGEELKNNWLEDYELRKRESIFVPTGIVGLDKRLTEGLARKKCSIWSARPGMGKTTTMANIALNVSRGKKDDKGDWIIEPRKVCLVPLETGHISYIDIMVSILIKERLEAEAIEEKSALPKSMIGMPLDKLVKYSDQITEKEDKLVNWALDEIFSNENLYVIDEPHLTLDELEIILENNNYDICIIDLWEKLSDIELDANKIAKKLNKTQQMAKSANIHMALVQQQRRNSKDAKKPQKPNMEALKNSGAYEEIADLIIFMHREKYYNPDLDEDVIEYIIAKQRRGEMNKTVFHDFHAPFGVIGQYRKNYIEETNEDVF